VTRGGCIRVNQNFSQELRLYLRINPMSLSSNSAKTVAIGKLSALEIRLGTATETWNSASKNTCKIDDTNRFEE
jgi:hypothetical protein